MKIWAYESIFSVISLKIYPRNEASAIGEKAWTRCVARPQDFVEEQGQVARLVMQLRADSADDQVGVLLAACERFTEGGPGRCAMAFRGLVNALYAGS